MAEKNNLHFSIEESLASLDKELSDIPLRLEDAANDAIKDVAESAYATILSEAQQHLNRTRLDYISGLRFEDIGNNSYIIYLEGDWANKLEDGYPPYDMRDVLLKSKKIVNVGSRAGQPWVQTGKEGQKYAHVPLEQSPSKIAQGAPDMAAAFKKLRAVNAKNRKQKITSIFKDPTGSPIQGKAATIKGSDSGFDGLVKYQNVVQTQKGKNRVENLYILYRTISENGKPWMHPGGSGLHAFQKAGQQVSKNLNQILEDLLK